MITFIISLVLITNQNDLKGFENKETAEYYAKIIGCEGYFESNINGDVSWCFHIRIVPTCITRL